MPPAPPAAPTLDADAALDEMSAALESLRVRASDISTELATQSSLLDEVDSAMDEAKPRSMFSGLFGVVGEGIEPCAYAFHVFTNTLRAFFAGRLFDSIGGDDKKKKVKETAAPPPRDAPPARPSRQRMASMTDEEEGMWLQ